MPCVYLPGPAPAVTVANTTGQKDFSRPTDYAHFMLIQKTTKL